MINKIFKNKLGNKVPSSIVSSDSGINSESTASFAKTDSANSPWVIFNFLPGLQLVELVTIFRNTKLTNLKMC
jgi:hypothetical protein